MLKVCSIRDSIKGTNGIPRGIEKLGDVFSLLDFTDPKINEMDCFLQTNMLKPKFGNYRNSIYQFILDSNKPFLVSESPSFRQYPGYNRLGWYNYKWTQGVFGNTNSPNDRWKKFQKSTNIKIKDWHSPGDAILIMGQKEGDSSLLDLYKEYDSFYDWVEKIIKDIKNVSDRPIIIRPHPRNRSGGIKLANKLTKKFSNITISKNLPTSNSMNGGEGLYEDFKKSHCVVTYNSLSAVEAVCEGIPTFALEHGSMIWPIAHKNLKNIENIDYNIDITQWCNDIAYTQWNRKEHKSGESWSHLKPLVFGGNNG